MIIINETQDIKETQFSKVVMELSAREALKSLKAQKIQGCCFKRRIADFFIICASRGFKNNVLPKLLTKNSKEKFDAFNISPETVKSKTRSLVDRQDFWNLFRVMAYANNIQKAGNNKEGEKWQKAHEIIVDGATCTRHAEEYFKGGFTSPINDSFEDLLNNEIPDDIIVQELSIELEFEEEEEEEEF